MMEHGKSESPTFATSLHDFQHPYQFISSIDEYLVYSTNSQPLTTVTEHFDGTLDWIFIEKNNLNIEKIWKQHEESILLEYQALPNKCFPSDHVPVVIEISFVNNEGK